MVQWLRLLASVQGALAQFLVGELRSHMPCSVAKIFKKLISICTHIQKTA